MNPLYKFEPKPDITVLELAEVLAGVLNCQSATFQSELLATMSDGGKRHFVEQGAEARTFFALMGGHVDT